MKDIVIVGSGGFAREVRMLIDSCNKVENIWNIIGWISNEPVGTMIDQLPVLGNDEWLIKCNREINAVIALGDGNMRKKLVNAYASNSNIIFPSIVSDTAVVGNTVSLGMGSIVSFNSIIMADIEIGDFFICNLAGTVGHDCKIGNYVTVNPGADIAGNVTIGDGVTIGMGANIIQGCRIGEYSTIGAGAAVIRDIPSYCTAVGVPARPLEK